MMFNIYKVGTVYIRILCNISPSPSSSPSPSPSLPPSLSLVFAMFGMLSPASHGALMTAAIVLFMFMG